MGEVMVEAGYSENTAIAPTKLTKSKGWIELMEKHLPDSLLAKKHLEGLNAVFTDKYNTDAEDFATRHKYLETAYKIKNKMPKDANLTAVQINFGGDKEMFA